MKGEPSALLRAAFADVQTMPRLRHKRKGRSFDPKRSRVLVWLGRSPGVRAWIMDSFRQSGAIVFDPLTREWRGKDTL